MSTDSNTNQRMLAILGAPLTTVEICYFIPKHRILNLLVFQQHDLPPRFPALNKLLLFWKNEIEGELHEVRVAVGGIFSPINLKDIREKYTLN